MINAVKCPEKYLLIISFFITILFSLDAFSHARLKASAGVAPRSNNAGIKTGPCGGFAKISTPPTLNAGSTFTVTWEETINHPGRYEFYFSKAGDANFVLLKTVPDTQDGGGLPHQYSTTVTLPNETCTGCTLQMIQVMTENPASPSLYFSCADMILIPSGATPSPTPTPGHMTPTPTPTPAEPCH